MPRAKIRPKWICCVALAFYPLTAWVLAGRPTERHFVQTLPMRHAMEASAQQPEASGWRVADACLQVGGWVLVRLDGYFVCLQYPLTTSPRPHCKCKFNKFKWWLVDVTGNHRKMVASYSEDAYAYVHICIRVCIHASRAGWYPGCEPLISIQLLLKPTSVGVFIDGDLFLRIVNAGNPGSVLGDSSSTSCRKASNPHPWKITLHPVITKI